MFVLMLFINNNSQWHFNAFIEQIVYFYGVLVCRDLIFYLSVFGADIGYCLYEYLSHLQLILKIVRQTVVGKKLGRTQKGLIWKKLKLIRIYIKNKKKEIICM